MLLKGQKVRLSARGLRSHKGNAKVDWTKRIGIIRYLSRDRMRASVIWEGNNSLSDPLPFAFLEVVEE
jgi:hypothetical protein